MYHSVRVANVPEVRFDSTVFRLDEDPQWERERHGQRELTEHVGLMIRTAAAHQQPVRTARQRLGVLQFGYQQAVAIGVEE